MSPTDSTTAWTLRFTEWRCGHHGQRPDDIACASPEQAKAILWAIACAISQPGHARAVVFSDAQGFPDIYITDDHCEFNPKRTAALRPEVVLCSDARTAAAILSADLKDAREDLNAPDLSNAQMWEGEQQVHPYDVVLTTMSRARVERMAAVDDSALDPVPPKFVLPPVFHIGAEVLHRVRERAAELRAAEADRAAEERGRVAPGLMQDFDPIIWRKDLCAKLKVGSETIRVWINAGKLPEPDVRLSLRTKGWKASTLRAAGLPF